MDLMAVVLHHPVHHREVDLAAADRAIYPTRHYSWVNPNVPSEMPHVTFWERATFRPLLQLQEEEEAVQLMDNAPLQRAEVRAGVVEKEAIGRGYGEGITSTCQTDPHRLVVSIRQQHGRG